MREKYSSILNDQIDSNLYERTKELFEEAAAQSLKNNADFSFQTNFDKSYTDKWRSDFAKKSYQTHLYYLYVSDINICIQRVAKRVKQGGHSVSKPEIIERYKKGLINLDKSFSKYDCVKLIDTSGRKSKLLFEIQDKKIITVFREMIEISEKHALNNMLEKIEEHFGK